MNGADTKSPDAVNPGDSNEDFKVVDRRFWSESGKEGSAESGEQEVRSELPSYVENLRHQVEEKDRKLKEYIAAYKKEVVENLEETKKRLERDGEVRIEAMRGEFALPLVEILEAVERSIQASHDSSDIAAVRDGVMMVQKLLLAKFKDFGLERIATIGETFDPSVHEAVAVTPADTPAKNNTVAAEFSPGFRLGTRVVRAAKVQVAKT